MQSLHTVCWEEVPLSRIKERIVEEQEHKCNCCKLHLWLDKPLTLELEHIDGDRTNNSRDNLECLCPNCHSYTDTWRGRNKTLRKRISEEDYVAALRSSNSIYEALTKLGLAAKGGNYKRASNLCSKYNIIHSPYSHRAAGKRGGLANRGIAKSEEHKQKLRDSWQSKSRVL